MKRGEREQRIWKSPKLQEQSHPFSFPTGAFKGQLRTKRYIAVQYIACPADRRKDKGDTTLFAGLYIHSHTHTHRLYSPFDPSPHRFEFPSYFFADLYMEGLTEVSTQSPDAQTKRIGSPLGWPPRSNASPICTLCCRGDRLGQTGDPCVAPAYVVSLLQLLGNMTTYTRPCQTHDWHVPARLDQQSHPRRANYPKT